MERGVDRKWSIKQIKTWLQYISLHRNFSLIYYLLFSQMSALVFSGKNLSLNRSMLFEHAQQLIANSPPNSIGIIIRKSYQNENCSPFGYYRQVNSENLKRICFKYLEHISDVVAFLFLHSYKKKSEQNAENSESPSLAFVFIEDLQDYLGYNLLQSSSQLIVLFNMMNKLEKKLGSRPSDQFKRVGFTVKTQASTAQLQKFTKMAVAMHADFYELLESVSQGSVTYNMRHNGAVYESPFTKDIFKKLKDYREKEVMEMDA